MAFPMMPTAQWDVVRKMGPQELNKAAMGEYQAQGISPVFALARIKEETALAAAFQAQEQKRQQNEEAKMQGVPVEEIPFTVAEGILRERGITGVDPSAGREMPPDKMAALQGGIAGGAMEEQPMAIEEQPMAMEEPMMAYGGGLIPGYHMGGPVHEHGIGPGEHGLTVVPDEAVGGVVYATDEDLVREMIDRESGMTQRERAAAEGPEALAAFEALHGVDPPHVRRARHEEEMQRQRDLEEIRDVEERAARVGLSPEVYMERTGYGIDPNAGGRPLPFPGQVPDSAQVQVPDSAQDNVVDVSGVSNVDVVPTQVPDPDDITPPQVPDEDIEYSRYSDPTIGPFNAMSQLSERISGIQQEYGPDKQALDALRRQQLQEGLTDLQRIQAAEDEAEVARREDITGIEALQIERGRAAKSAINRTRGTQADARRDAQTQQERIEATRAMTQGQLEDHAFKRDATGASQLEEYRDATNRRADAALFTGVGDQLRKPGRDQSFGDVASAVGDIRGDALTATQKIQTYLLDEERKDIDALYESETLANRETRESQDYLLNKQVSSDTEITRIAHELLDDRGTSEEKVRGIEEALRDDDIEQLRVLLAAERAIRDFPITLAGETIAREVDPLVADFERMSRILPAELSRIGSERYGLAQSRSTQELENFMMGPGSIEDAQRTRDLGVAAVNGRWSKIEDDRGRRLSPEEEAEREAEVEVYYDNFESLAARISQWQEMLGQLLIDNPTLARTINSLNIRYGQGQAADSTGAVGQDDN